MSGSPAFSSPTRDYPGLIGHLPLWGADALALLEEGAALGPVFAVQLWRQVVTGHSPEWNRFVLGDMADFRSRGLMSQLSPYLAAGVVAADAPGRRARRVLLNPAFHRRVITGRFAEVVHRHHAKGIITLTPGHPIILRRQPPTRE